MHHFVDEFSTCALFCAYFLIMKHNSILIVLREDCNFWSCNMIKNLCTKKCMVVGWIFLCPINLLLMLFHRKCKGRHDVFIRMVLVRDTVLYMQISTTQIQAAWPRITLPPQHSLFSYPPMRVLQLRWPLWKHCICSSLRDSHICSGLCDRAMVAAASLITMHLWWPPW